jgi:hypothetical protein
VPAEIGQLTALTELHLDGNRLSGLPAKIGQLKELTELHLNGNQLSALPVEICQLTALTELYLQGNKISALPAEIRQLKALTELHLDGNRLSALPVEIGRLTELTKLHLNGNQLRGLPKEIRRLTCLTELYLHDNPHLDIPPEVLGPTAKGIKQRGAGPADPKAIFDYYFSRQSLSAKPLNEVKLVVVGRGGTGKTSLVERLVHDRFDPQQKETLGVSLCKWPMKKCPSGEVLAHVWDFAGQTITHSMHQFFLSVRAVYILLLTGRENSEREDAEYWLRLIAAYGTDAEGNGPPVIVALNKWDDPGSARPRVDRRALKERYRFIVDFLETDCLTATGIPALRVRLEEVVDQLPWVRAPFPATYQRVKRALEAYGDAHLPYDEYRRICLKCGVKEEERQDLLAENLHALGVALNYRKDERLRFASVLKPEWLTANVYRLVRHTEKKAGVLERSALATVLAEEKQEAMRIFLVEMMVRFELAYPLAEDGAAPDRWLLPQSLPDTQPEGIEAFRDNKGATRLRYRYRALPVSLVPRFIVRTHPLIKKNLRWASGVVLVLRDAEVLVRADSVEKEIEITVTGGTETRQELAGLALQEFRLINGQIKDLNPQEEMMAEGGWVPLRGLEQDERKGSSTGVVTEHGTVQVNPTEKLNELSAAAARNDSWKPRVFICYSQKDDAARVRLELHLKILRTRGLLDSARTDQSLNPGDDWDARIKAELERADVIIILVSAAALGTDYIRKVEIPRAMELHEAGQTLAIAVILERCGWADTELGKWQAILPNRKPVRDNKPIRNGWAIVEEKLGEQLERKCEERRGANG